VDGLTVPEQEVERDEVGRDLSGELAHPAFGRVESHLQGVELEPPVAVDHDLAVERRVGRHQITEPAELGEVAQKGPSVPAPEGELTAVVLEHAAESVPFRLVLEPVVARHLANQFGLHGWERNVRPGHQRSCAQVCNRPQGVPRDP
jgi:hypothetical protein